MTSDQSIPACAVPFPSDHPMWPSGRVFGFWCPPPTAEVKRDKSSMLHSFEGISGAPFYPTGNPWALPAENGYPEQKWDATVYPFPFPQTEQYPSDPFPSTPSTSVASPLEYKVNPQYYHNPLLTQGYMPTTDYSQVFNSWKMPSSVKSPSKNTPTLPYRTGPGTNNVRVRTSEKYRMVYTEYQRLELEKEYHTQPFVTSERKSDLSTQLNLTERQIKIWFQNRRAKDRRDKKK